MASAAGQILYLLFVVVVPVFSTWGAVALLAGAFRGDRQPNLRKIFGSVAALLVPGLSVFAAATGSGYSGLVAIEVLIVASATALVGAVVLVVKPPATRRLAALLLVTAYPLVLFILGWAGSLLSSGATQWIVIGTG